jgi:hypothetical protein
MTVKIRRALPKDVQFGRRVMDIQIAAGLPHVNELSDELQHMTNVILGRLDSPLDSPYLALMEVATAYYCRGQEIDMLIHEAERKQIVEKGSDLAKFRTGELRAFLEMSKRAAELGSRRLTQEVLLSDQRSTDSI